MNSQAFFFFSLSNHAIDNVDRNANEYKIDLTGTLMANLDSSGNFLKKKQHHAGKTDWAPNFWSRRGSIKRPDKKRVGIPRDPSLVQRFLWLVLYYQQGKSEEVEPPPLGLQICCRCHLSNGKWKLRTWLSWSRNCLSLSCFSYGRSNCMDSPICPEEEGKLSCIAMQHYGLSGVESQSFCQPWVRPLIYFPNKIAPHPQRQQFETQNCHSINTNSDQKNEWNYTKENFLCLENNNHGPRLPKQLGNIHMQLHEQPASTHEQHCVPDKTYRYCC